MTTRRTTETKTMGKEQSTTTALTTTQKEPKPDPRDTMQTLEEALHDPALTDTLTFLRHPIIEYFERLTRNVSCGTGFHDTQLIHMVREVAPDKRLSRDSYGNYFLTLGTQSGNPEVMFCAHLDTVDTATNSADAGTPRRVLFDGVCMAHAPVDEGVLGADDRSGVAMLLWLIRNRVPGLYAFFQDEEGGGRGSKAALTHFPRRYDDVKIAVAFDRKGHDEIITRQRGQTCCSEAFRKELDKQLSDGIVDTKTKKRWEFKAGIGSFTDTATFMKAIPECTNIAIGYKGQHSNRETQDLGFLALMAEQVLKVKWDELPVVRDPKKVESHGYQPYSYYAGPTYAGSIRPIVNWLYQKLEYAQRKWDSVARKYADKGGYNMRLSRKEFERFDDPDNKAHIMLWQVLGDLLASGVASLDQDEFRIELQECQLEFGRYLRMAAAGHVEEWDFIILLMYLLWMKPRETVDLLEEIAMASSACGPTTKRNGNRKLFMKALLLKLLQEESEN